MKTGRSQNTKLTKQFGLFSLSTIIVLFLVAVLLAPITMVQAANPTSNSLSPATGASVTWNGTAPGGASPDGEATCVEGTNCDTFTLTVAEGDWSGKFIKVNIAWNLPASDYDFIYIKDQLPDRKPIVPAKPRRLLAKLQRLIPAQLEPEPMPSASYIMPPRV
jgi:hypothetical protein